MLADRLQHAQIIEFQRPFWAAGHSDGFAYTEWSQDEGATNELVTDTEIRGLVSGIDTALETPGYWTKRTGWQYCALSQGGQVRVYQSALGGTGFELFDVLG